MMETIFRKICLKSSILLNSILLVGLVSVVEAQSIYSLEEGTTARGVGVWDSTFHISYVQKYTQDEQLTLDVLNSKGKVVRKVPVVASKGENIWSFVPKKLGLIKKDNSVFYLQFETKRHQVYTLEYRVKVLDNPLKAAIKVEAAILNCGVLSPSEFNVESTIKNGQEPYSVTWIISNDKEGVDLIAKPIHEKYATREEVESKVFRFSLAEPKYITFYAIDACGQEYEEVNKIECDGEEGNDFTMTFQNLEKESTGIK